MLISVQLGYNPAPWRVALHSITAMAFYKLVTVLLLIYNTGGERESCTHLAFHFYKIQCVNWSMFSFGIKSGVSNIWITKLLTCFVTLTFSIFFAGLSGAKVRSSIVGGHDAPKGRWPWMVHLNITSDGINRWRCGGTILNNQWVLTAASCWER